MVKIGREEPVASMDSSGKIIWARHNEVQTVNVKSLGADYEVGRQAGWAVGRQAGLGLWWRLVVLAGGRRLRGGKAGWEGRLECGAGVVPG